MPATKSIGIGMLGHGEELLDSGPIPHGCMPLRCHPVWAPNRQRRMRLTL